MGALWWLLVACGGGRPDTKISAGAAAPASGRTVGVTVSAEQLEKQTADFCEVRASASEARSFALPPLDGSPMASSEGWRWVNVWATWCGPCVEEMPMLLEWQGRLAREGVNVALQFLSVDAKAEDVAAWRAAKPGRPPSMRAAVFADVQPWMVSTGLSADAVVPIHYFVDGDDKIRCVRTGAVDASHYGTVKRVLSGG